MNYIILPKADSESTQMYLQISDDNTRKIQCTDQYPPFVEWKAEGNEPEEQE
jgi:hypothetical protein|tara:strand:+ start:1174 stop:1329 length:156 start_codon:yes stop_codon:yes gene_type:complete